MYSLFLCRIPDRFPSIKTRSGVRHTVNTVQVGGIKEIINQAVMIRVQTGLPYCNGSEMLRWEKKDGKRHESRLSPKNPMSGYKHDRDNRNGIHPWKERLHNGHGASMKNSRKKVYRPERYPINKLLHIFSYTITSKERGPQKIVNLSRLFLFKSLNTRLENIT